ncbi:hypothetical protein Pan258_53970 [Symmachiella dynata]|uniref:hypothetical protein n=1 Tax=Symmachiella dynata TaxID=2527995 RepID=UPI001188E263|nr:hypothetical protein [Symmachiella dynata]QDT51308.1 hypothetical protein Pan258_53970 [Symmachiella dynata]
MSATLDIRDFEDYLSSTACRFLQQRGTRTPVTESDIAACCSNGASDGIKLSPTQAEHLRVFAGLRYQPFGADPNFYSSCFEDWAYPDHPYQRGIISEKGDWSVGRFVTGTFGEEGLWMGLDGSLSDDCTIDRILVHESLVKPIECDAAIWDTAQPHLGVAWIREGVPLDEFQARIPGDLIEHASDDLNCVFRSRDTLCLWTGWEAAFTRKYSIGYLRGSRLEICSSSPICFDEIIKSLDAAGVLLDSSHAAK